MDQTSTQKLSHSHTKVQRGHFITMWTRKGGDGVSRKTMVGHETKGQRVEIVCTSGM